MEPKLEKLKESHTKRFDRSHKESAWDTWKTHSQVNIIHRNSTDFWFVSRYANETL